MHVQCKCGSQKVLLVEIVFAFNALHMNLKCLMCDILWHLKKDLRDLDIKAEILDGEYHAL